MPSNDPRPSKRYVSSDGPVNRRTSVKLRPAASPVLPAALRKRVAEESAQQAIGAALRIQLQAGATRASPPRTRVLPAVCLALTLVGAFMAWMQASVGLAAVAVALGVASVAGGWMMRRRSAPNGQAVDVSPSRSVFDPTSVEALDRVVAEMAPALRDSAKPRLADIKATLARIAPRMAAGAVSEAFTQDDHFYVAELVRRYLPDTLQAYLQVPAAQRSLPAGDTGRSAQDLLDEQLDLLRAGLAQREQGLLRMSTEALELQQRFLHARRGG